jgi:hypothetical protein
VDAQGPERRNRLDTGKTQASWKEKSAPEARLFRSGDTGQFHRAIPDDRAYFSAYQKTISVFASRLMGGVE